MSTFSPTKPTITGYSFILAADSHVQDGEKKTFLNVEYEFAGASHHAKIPMHKDEFAEIRSDLNASRVVDILARRH